MATRSRYVASFSLAIMGTGFIITSLFHDSLAGAILQGGFEAGLVGGLADWFAVTALFRHPLNLPIPHTALLTKNRQKLTEGIVSMLENKWLTKTSITDKMKEIHLAEKVFLIIEKELHSDSMKRGITTAIEHAIRRVNINKIASFVEKEIKQYLYSIHTSALIQSAINQILAHSYDEKALNYLLMKAKGWAEKDSVRNELGSTAIKAIDRIELDGFLQFAVKSFINVVDENKLGGIIQDFILRGIDGLQETDNKNRQALLEQIRTELKKVHENTTFIKELDDWKEHLIENWDATEQITKTLEKMQQQALFSIKDGEFVDMHLLPFLTRLLNNTKENPVHMGAIENWLQKQVIQFVEANHSKIGKLVRENLDALDDQTLIAMIENGAGKDLQWIRVNGAICGFMLGLLLEVIKATTPL
ncbi:DUF445 domain-containing protein [Ectobacillus funiculus]|uniref:DUF445 domain-containing protein n=1 Tax=Ectobacillus funiculus TaxID=137993 RepID=UPI00397A2F77